MRRFRKPAAIRWIFLAGMFFALACGRDAGMGKKDDRRSEKAVAGSKTSAELINAAVPTARYGHTAVWDTANNRMIMFGGAYSSYDYSNDVWILSKTGSGWAWTKLTPSGTLPHGRSDHTAVWDAANSRMIVFGGYYYDGSNHYLNDVWVLSKTGSGWAWTKLTPSGTLPHGRSDHTAVWDAANSRMVVFGGSYYDGSNHYLNDVWVLSKTGSGWAWTKITPSGTPPHGRVGHTAVWDTANSRMIVFGGWYAGGYRNDVWGLSQTGTQWQWTKITPSGTLPSAHWSHTAVWDAANSRMIVFGGAYYYDGNGHYLNDVWVLNQAGSGWQWTKVIPSGTPPHGRSDHTAVWDAANSRMIVFGGNYYDGSPHHLNDVWVLSQTGSGWQWTDVTPFRCETAPPTPTLVSPADGATIDQCGPTLTWSVPDSVVGYRFEVYVNDALVVTTTNTSFTLPASLALNPTDTWQVKAVGCPGNVVESGIFTFSVSIPAPASPVLNPMAGFNCDSAGERTFSWTDSETGVVFDLVLNGERVRTDITGTSVTLPAGFGYEATNTYQVAARNCAHETLSAEGAFDVTSDTTPERPTITSPANNAMVYCNPTIEWTYPTDTTGITFDIVKTDGTVLKSSIQCAASPCSYTLTGAERLVNGTYTYRVVARNCAGGNPARSGARSFIVNNTPIPPVLTSPSEGQVTNGTPTFTWSVTGTQKPGVTYSIFMDNQTDTSLVSGLTTLTYTAPAGKELTEGSHTWEVTAYGCMDTPAESGWRGVVVDRTGPQAFSLLSPVDGTWTNTASGTMDIAWSASADTPAGVTGYEVWVDGALAGTTDGATTTYVYNFTLQASYSWFIRAVDAVGNTTDSTETWAFGIDRTPPAPFTLTAPADGEETQAMRPTFTWNAATDALSGIDHYELFINGDKAAPDVPAGTLTTTPDQDVPEGSIPWKVVAVDKAGNRRDSNTRHLIVDRTPPGSATLISVTPKGTGDWVSSQLPTFEFTADDNPGGSGIDHFELYIDGVKDEGGGIPAGAGGCSHTCTSPFDLLADGSHQWYVVAYDYVGLSKQSETGTFVVETKPPLAFTHTSPTNGVTVQTFYPLLCWNRTTDEGSGMLEYRVNIKKAGSSDVNITVPDDEGTGEICARPTSPLTNGSYTWLVTAVDKAGNQEPANNNVRWTMTVEKDVTPPVSTVTQPATDGGLKGCAATAFAGTASDPGPTATAPAGSGVVLVEVQLDGTAVDGWHTASLGGDSSDKVRQWQWTWADPTTGSHTLYVRAKDHEGNVQTNPTTRTLKVDCTGPLAFGLQSPAEGAFVGRCPTFRWDATTDSPAGMDRYELKVQGSGSGAPVVIDVGNTTGYTLSGNDCLSGGTFTWNVTAYDKLGNSTESNSSRTFNVDTQGPAAFPLTGQTPVNSDGWACNNRKVTVTWSPSEDLGSAGGVGMADNPYQVYMDGAPVGGRRSQTTYEFTNLADGAHTWTVRAYDKLGNWTAATVVAPLGAFSIDCTGPGLSTTGSFRLYANHIPTYPLNTGIDVSTGDQVRIWASGELCFADDASCNPSWSNQGGCMGPEGQWTFPSWVISTKYYRNLAFGSVLALIGDDLGSPIAVGTFASFAAASSGRLKIATNDDDRYNCVSRWDEVTIHVGPGFNLLFPVNGVVSDEVLPTFTWSDVTDDGCGVQRIEVLVNNSVVTLTGGLPAAATNYTLPKQAELTEKDNTWQVKVYDKLGNMTASPVWTIRTDLTPPEPFDVTTPAEGDVVKTKTPDLCWQGTTDTRSSVANYLIFIDDAYNTAQYPDQSCQQPREALSDGRHCFYVKAGDELRHERQSTHTRCFVVDTLPPDPFSLVSPADKATSHTALPEFCWQTATDSGTGVQHYELWLSGNLLATVAQPQAFPMPEKICWKAASPLPNGTYEWFVKAVDGADAVTVTDPWQITIERDVTPPDTAITTPAAGELYGSKIQVEGTANDGVKGTGVARVEVFDASDPDTAKDANFDQDTGKFTMQWTATADGELTLCARAWDNEGNADPQTGTNAYPCVTFRTDISPPAPFRVLLPASDQWTGTRPTFTWESTTDSPAGVAHYYLQIEGQPEIDAGTALSYELSGDEALAEGAYSWTVRAVDKMGNSRQAGNTETFRVDGRGPSAVELKSPPDGTWVNSGRPGLCWNPATDEGGSGLGKYRVRVDGQTYEVTADKTCFQPDPPLSEGSHKWDVAAVDQAGNAGPVSAEWTVLVDLTAPPVPVPTYPDDGMHVRDNPPVFHWQPVQDLPKGKASGVCGYVVTLNDRSLQAGASDKSLTWDTEVTDGEMKWTVRAFDCAGNQGQPSEARTLLLDTVKPAEVEITAPAEGAWLADARPVIKWNASKDSDSGICGYKVTLDGVEHTVDKDTLEWQPGSDIEDGSHEVSVVAVDCAGNLGVEAKVTFGTDVTPPVAAEPASPGDSACVSSATPEFTWTACTDAASGMDGVFVVVDGKDVSGALGPDIVNWTPSLPLEEGGRIWAVRCVDKAGNSVVSPDSTFNVDLTPPVVAIQEVTKEADGLMVHGLVTDSGPCGLGDVTIQVDRDTPVLLILDPETGEWTWLLASPQEGSYKVVVLAKDAVGNNTAPAIATILVNQCWQQGTCSPETRICGSAREGTGCDDENACTENDTCDADGTCAGTAITCNDDNPCTDDSCDSEKGCVFTNNTVACNDGNACTENDACADGTCAGTAITCNDDNPCTDDSCDSEKGCVFTNNTVACNDGNACTENDACADGTCSGTAITCDDDNPCTDDSCDSETGCVFTNNMAQCDDGDACTENDVCADGACAGTAITCNDHNLCTNDSCDSETGCVFTNNTSACDDENACTENDVCADGACAGVLIECQALDQCYEAGTCDQATGACTNPAKKDGTPCDDGNPSTGNDSCQQGVCLGEGCKCNTVGACCDGCMSLNEGGACDDENACTENDVCADGSCAGTAITCDDHNLCTADSCDSETGCVFTNNTAACDDHNLCTDNSCDPATGCVFTNNTSACDDGNACTENDACADGSCAGTVIVCDDHNPCTDDSCDPATGCVFTNNTAACDDGIACTEKDVCADGECNGVPVQCQAVDQCHDAGTCDQATGRCSNPVKADGTLCDDGNPWTENDQCDGNGICLGEGCQCSTIGTCCDGCMPLNEGGACDDGNLCTTKDTCVSGFCTGRPLECPDGPQCSQAGVCNPKTGACDYSPVKDGTDCDDQDPATTDEQCVNGMCVPPNCECVGVTACCDGCQPINEGGTCDDSNACTTTDTCTAGRCVGSEPVICPRPDACHETAVCNPETGECPAKALPVGTPCDDGDLCSKGDVCDENGECSGTPFTCSELTQCQESTECDGKTCQVTNKAAGTNCDDNDPCTENDQCDDKGTCEGTPIQDCVGEDVESVTDGPLDAEVLPDTTLDAIEETSAEDVESMPDEPTDAEVLPDTAPDQDSSAESMPDTPEDAEIEGSVIDTSGFANDNNPDRSDAASNDLSNNTKPSGGGCATGGRGMPWAGGLSIMVFVILAWFRRRRYGNGG